jgi:hypothetical protein
LLEAQIVAQLRWPDGAPAPAAAAICAYETDRAVFLGLRARQTRLCWLGLGQCASGSIRELL